MTAEQLALVDDHIRIGLAMHPDAAHVAALVALRAELARLRGAISVMLPTCEAALEVLEGLTAPEEGEIEPWLETQLKTAIEAAKEATK